MKTGMASLVLLAGIIVGGILQKEARNTPLPCQERTGPKTETAYCRTRPGLPIGVGPFGPVVFGVLR